MGIFHHQEILLYLKFCSRCLHSVKLYKLPLLDILTFKLGIDTEERTLSDLTQRKKTLFVNLKWLSALDIIGGL